MKKSTIWILGIVMGLSFLSLLYLQVSYIEEMMKTRKEQFDSAVRNSLSQVSKDVEYAETQRWLVEDITEAERKALTENNSSLRQDDVVQSTQRFKVKSRDGKIISDFEMRVMTIKPSELPKVMVRGRNTIPQTSNSMLEAIKNRYMYQRALLDEVVLDMIRRASDKSIGERVRFGDLNGYLQANLYNNGIDLPFHYEVLDKEGRSVYRCADYEEKGSDEAYQQALFKNDPPAKTSVLKVHFPGRRDYLFDSVSFMIPSLIFTLVLLVTFIFTIYIVFRQKKLTEMKNDFINNMTHEFKTPISTISLAAQMLKDPAVGKSPQMFQHISGVINDETKRLRFQVEKVLQMSMFDRQKATLKMKEIDANELITGVVNTFALKVERYNGKITSNLEATDPVIFADEMHITNVIFNLMDNAVKYKKPSSDLDGKDIFTLLRKRMTGRDLFWHFPAYLESYKKSGKDWRATPYSSIRSGEWKLIYYYEDETMELYNLKNDLSEVNDLSDSQPAKKEELYKKLSTWLKQTKAPIPTELNPDYQGGK